MQVIFLFIPATTTLEELERFALSGLGFRLPFMNNSKILHCEILDVLDNSSKLNESHGVVSFASPRDAQKVIEKLNGKPFKGKAIKVREFVNRSPSDKRLHQVRGAKDIFMNSRRESLMIRKRTQGNKAKPNNIHSPNVLYSPQPDIPFEREEPRKRRK